MVHKAYLEDGSLVAEYSSNDDQPQPFEIVQLEYMGSLNSFLVIAIKDMRMFGEDLVLLMVRPVAQQIDR